MNFVGLAKAKPSAMLLPQAMQHWFMMMQEA
jgi:hypothetical protein